MGVRSYLRPARFQRCADYRPQFDTRFVQHDLAPTQAFDVEQVVYQPHQMVSLPLYHPARSR
jgi:hypothetical protein